MKCFHIMRSHMHTVSHKPHMQRHTCKYTHMYSPLFCSRRPREHTGVLTCTLMCAHSCTGVHAQMLCLCAHVHAMFGCSQGHCPQPGPASLTSQKAPVTRTLFSAALPRNRYPGAVIVGGTGWSPLSCAGDMGLGQTLSNPQRKGCVCAAGEEGIPL